MNDFQKVVSLLKNLGIKYKVEKDDRYGSKCAIHITVDNDTPGSKVKGYGEFTNTYFFNEEGMFVQLNIWE